MLYFLLCLLLAIPPQATPLKDHDYDPDNGQDINELCAGCHGETGEGGGDGEYPRLAGLPAKYLAGQMWARALLRPGQFPGQRSLRRHKLNEWRQPDL